MNAWIRRARSLLGTALVCKLALAIVLPISFAAQAQEPAPALPASSFAELEAVGATIGEIRIVNRDIFDLENPQEDKPLFRWANRLHIQTQVGVIRARAAVQER